MKTHEVKEITSRPSRTQKNRGQENITHGFLSSQGVFRSEALEKGQSAAVGNGTVIDHAWCAMSPQSRMVCGLCHMIQGTSPYTIFVERKRYLYKDNTHLTLLTRAPI